MTNSTPLLETGRRPRLSSTTLRIWFWFGITCILIAVVILETKYKSDAEEAEAWQLQLCNTTIFRPTGFLDFQVPSCQWQNQLMFNCGEPADPFCLAYNTAFFQHTWPCYAVAGVCQELPRLTPVDLKSLPSFKAFIVLICFGTVLAIMAGFELWLRYYCGNWTAEETE